MTRYDLLFFSLKNKKTRTTRYLFAPYSHLMLRILKALLPPELKGAILVPRRPTGLWNWAERAPGKAFSSGLQLSLWRSWSYRNRQQWQCAEQHLGSHFNFPQLQLSCHSEAEEATEVEPKYTVAAWICTMVWAGVLKTGPDSCPMMPRCWCLLRFFGLCLPWFPQAWWLLAVRLWKT